MRITQNDRKWQEKLYTKAKNLAGKRYTPDINVELPISQTFDGLARNDNFYTRVRQLFGEFRKNRTGIFPKNNLELLGEVITPFDYCFEELLSQLNEIKEYSTYNLPWKDIRTSVEKLEDYSWKLQDKIYEVRQRHAGEKKSEHSEIFNSEEYYLSKLRRLLYKLNELASSDAAKLSNHHFLLLTGVTGIGKTHLLCDLVKNRIESGSYSFITLGQEINAADDIWKQILRQNNDSRIKSKTELLKKFDGLGEKTKSRFLIIIDALNESSNPSSWKKGIVTLLKEIRPYSNISLIVSIRNGFEREVMTSNVRKRFHEVEHIGFKFREWEAIKEFFTRFGIPLPEIPLINSEFSVPLFLLLFCKSRQLRAAQKGNRQLFRGHEGSTSIFEDFIKGVSEEIGKDFKIGSSGDVWVKLIKPLAEAMVNSRGDKDKISEDQFKRLLIKELPGVDFALLTSSLEKNHLLIKVPRYGKRGNRIGFDYRFTYQRFSDHLISRYLLNKYANKKIYGNKAKDNLKKVLRKDGTIGKYFYNYSLRGIINALSIQIPERLDGEELIDLCPWAGQFLEDPFLDSIIWRDPKAFFLNKKGNPEKTTSIINRLILSDTDGHSRFFSAVLNVAGVPNHPFNASILHHYLMRLGMPVRDKLWSSNFLHYNYGEKGSVDRLLHWVLSSSFNKSTSNQSKLLMGIMLTWFLATSDRSLRDKTTKGLVILLENSPEVLLELNERFISVDDPYITERLYAVNYSVLLRLNNYKHPSLAKLGNLIYKNIFLAKKPIAHILVRDYAKYALDLLTKHKVYIPPDMTKLNAIQNTKWPKRLLTMKTLEEKFEPKNFNWENATYQDRGVRAIWNSFDGIADFFRYIVSPVINHWSMTKLDEAPPPSIKELENDFEFTLNRAQKYSYAQIKKLPPVTRIFTYLTYKKENSTPEEAQMIKKEKELDRAIALLKSDFMKSLSLDQKVKYRKLLRQTRYNYPRKSGGFDPELAKRWILKRVFELYNSDLHGRFDGHISTHYDNGRSDHPTERIGKKYQWIALHELLGYLADNFRFLESNYPPEYGEYKGAWQIGIRDIDPSCIALHKPSAMPPWKPKYDAWKAKEASTVWLKRKADLPNPIELLLYKDSQGIEWYIFDSSYKWEQDIPPEEERYQYPTRDIWYNFSSFLIKNIDAEKLFKWSQNQNFYGRWMPEIQVGIQDCFFREFPDSDAYKNINLRDGALKDGWITRVGFHKRMPGAIMQTNDEFSVTTVSRDKSVEESFNIGLPSKWLVQYLSIKQSNNDGIWVNKSGDEICSDLSLREGGAAMLAVEKKAFLKFLKRNKFSVIWMLVGEKGSLAQEQGRLQQISGTYLLKSDGNITGKFRLISDKDRH
jgi:hypothetical protein